MDNMGNAEVTMEKLMEEFEIYLGNKAERTKKLYMENMRQFDFSDLPTKRHIARKTNEWLDNGLSYNTILARYSALKKFLHTFSRYFSAEDIKDMISYMGELKGYTPETIYAKPEQVERIIKTAEHREALAVALMFYMGMRISDVVALRMEQFKRDKAGNVFLKYRDKKTKKLHEVQLFENVGLLYHLYVFGQREKIIGNWKPSQNIPSEDGKYLFVGQKGKLTARWLQKQVKKLCVYCGFPDLHCHSFRHGCGTAYAKAGASANVIQKVLGHANMNTSMRYIHLAEEDVFKVGKEVFGV